MNHLRLGGNTIGDKGAEALARSTLFTCVCVMSATEARRAAIRFVARHRRLTFLDMYARLFFVFVPVWFDVFLAAL